MSKQEVSSRQDVTMGANISPLGRMSAISQNTNTSNLDWALIQLDRQDVLSTVSKVPQFGPVQSFVKSMPARGKVQVITASNGILKGTIFGIPTFMQQPYSVAFQEMWTVRLDGPLRKYREMKLNCLVF
jgi:hypothetical protein